MRILLVLDQFFGANNGMTISAQRFARGLGARGHEVRVLCTAANGSDAEFYAYTLPVFHVPVFDGLISAQGMAFARPVESTIEEAVAWAEMIHFYVPFALTHRALAVARAMKKPYTAAFHVQPENVSASIHLGGCRPVNQGIYLWFRHYVFQYCSHIHCPSRFIAGKLRQAGYRGKLHVISNGIEPDFHYRKIEKSPEYQGKFIILSVGRLSGEKRQDVLLKAVGLSKYGERIQVVLAGQGPKRELLERLAAGLANPPVIRFFKKPELLDLIAMSDLYVHTANAEIEAMSCMEAFAGGLVPVIANSINSATPQFALDARSLFRADDPEDLAKRIDYWIEHPEERREMEHRYGEFAGQYRLSDSVERLEAMFMEAMGEAQG